MRVHPLRGRDSMMPMRLFSEKLHNLGGEPQYTDYVNANMMIADYDDVRDKRRLLVLHLHI